LFFCFERTLFPVYFLHKVKIIDRVRKEKWSLKVTQFCSRWLMRVFPFASKSILVNADDEQVKNPEPSIWVCNHISMLDLFFVLALDKKMRGKNRRPIKLVYWKGLESNPVTCLLCRMCGFIPVDMAANRHGDANKYDSKSFKQMLKSTKAAIEEGFDIGIMPEGQPNPTPEDGLQPIFSGAFTLAKMSRRPIKMIALYGLHRMWHPDDNIGMECAARNMAVRVYPNGRVFKDAEEFSSTFGAVVGYFGAHGKDMPEEELNMWLDGSKWESELARRAATRNASIEDADQEETRKENSTDRSAKTQSMK
jgi:1-acyl-sn-glycerol-3-phosphate acyltransferase